MDRNEFIGKLQMCYFGDRNAFEEIVGVYDKQKEVLDKIKEYIKEKVGTEIHDMMYVIDVSDILELLEEIE